jgi:hypothetical protein
MRGAHLPPSLNAMLLGSALILYGIFINVYSGKVKQDGERYEPNPGMRIYPIVFGTLLLLLGFYLRR